MKLLVCLDCNDVFKLGYKLKSCSCGSCSGKYVDNSEATISGNCISLAIGNGSLAQAVRNLMFLGNKEDREFYIKNCKVEYCWVRPNSGNGNPHTTYVEEL